MYFELQHSSSVKGFDPCGNMLLSPPRGDATTRSPSPAVSKEHRRRLKPTDTPKPQPLRCPGHVAAPPGHREKNLPETHVQIMMISWSLLSWPVAEAARAPRGKTAVPVTGAVLHDLETQAFKLPSSFAQVCKFGMG